MINNFSLITSVLLAGASVSALGSEMPTCVNIGTRSEGWLSQRGLKWANCDSSVAVCAAIGTRSEGWYSAPKAALKYEALIKFATCSSLKTTPTCDNIGTRSEGWYFEGSLISFANCKNQEAVCHAIGTRSEGFYAIDTLENPLELISWDNCAGAR